MENKEDTVVGRLQVQVFTDTGRVHWNTIYSVVGMTYAPALQDLKREMEWVRNNPRQYLCHPREMNYLRIVIDGVVAETSTFPESADKFAPSFDAPVSDEFAVL